MTKQSQDYAEKYTSLEDEMRKRFKGLYFNSFFLNGLPDNIEEKWVKGKLFEKGYVDFVKTDFGFMAIETTNGLLNYYNEPTNVTAVSSNGNVITPSNFTKDNFARVYANSVKQAPARIVDEYISKLINIEKIINQQIAQFRRGLIANIGDGDKNDVYQLFNQLDEGREEIAVFNSKLGDLGLTMKSTYPPYYVGDLYKYKKEIESDLLTELGIDNNAIQKESGVSNVEASANDDEVIKTKNANIREMKLGFAKVEKMFKVSIKVSENEDEQKESEEPKEENENDTKTD